MIPEPPATGKRNRTIPPGAASAGQPGRHRSSIAILHVGKRDQYDPTRSSGAAIPRQVRVTKTRAPEVGWLDTQFSQDRSFLKVSNYGRVRSSGILSGIVFKLSASPEIIWVWRLFGRQSERHAIELFQIRFKRSIT